MIRIFSFLVLLTFSGTSISQDLEAYTTSQSGNRIIYSGHTIKLFAGQRITISQNVNQLTLIDTARSRIVDMNFMPRILEQNAEKNICLDFNIVAGEDGKPNTILLVNNPFKDTLTYKAKIYSSKTNSYEETSIWDVSPGVSGLEHWPYAIGDIILYDFKLKN